MCMMKDFVYVNASIGYIDNSCASIQWLKTVNKERLYPMYFDSG